MNPTFQLDMTGFRAGAAKLLAAKNVGVEQLIKDQSRLFTRDVLRMTPPFGSASVTESFNVQRRTGEARVAKDLAKVFSPLNIISKSSSPLAKALRAAVARADTRAIRAMLKNLGITQAFLLDPSALVHAAARDKRGRVRRGTVATLILDERALKRYTAARLAHVGKTKAGWLTAARGLGVTGIPAWISRHAGQTAGLLRIERAGGSYAIALANLSPHAGQVAQLGIIRAALDNRARAMGIQAEKILAAQLRRA